MTTHKQELDFQLTADELEKIKILESMGKMDLVILLLKESINDNYQKIYESSTKETFRTYFSKHISEFVNDNKSYGVPSMINETTIKDIQNGMLKHNMAGFVKNCRNENALILEVTVQKNIPALQYSEIGAKWQEITTTLVNFRTVEGNYLYVSALNTLKTESSAEKYLQRIQNYYNYKKDTVA